MKYNIKTDARIARNIWQYDAMAKEVLAQKSVLAHILVGCVKEFYGMNPKEVEPFIEGEVYVGRVPVEPGHTNAKQDGDITREETTETDAKTAEINNIRASIDAKTVEKNSKTTEINEKALEATKKIVGLNTENEEINEGLVRFDILFYVRMKDGLTQMIINIEAQKDAPAEYDLVNRGIFYASRLISSQKERDFTNMCYNDIKQVYSIWICMNQNECSINHIHLTDEALRGHVKWKGNLDLFNVIMIGLSNTVPEKEIEHDLLRLLAGLFSRNVTGNEREEIEVEYDVNATRNVEKKESENSMCNLGEGLVEYGYEKGMAEGEAKGARCYSYKCVAKGKLTPEEAAEDLDCTVEELLADMQREGFTVPEPV